VAAGSDVGGSGAGGADVITPDKLFLVIKKTVLGLGMSDLIGLGMSNPKSYTDLSPALKAAFEKAAAELNEK